MFHHPSKLSHTHILLLLRFPCMDSQLNVIAFALLSQLELKLHIWATRICIFNRAWNIRRQHRFHRNILSKSACWHFSFQICALLSLPPCLSLEDLVAARGGRKAECIWSPAYQVVQFVFVFFLDELALNPTPLSTRKTKAFLFLRANMPYKLSLNLFVYASFSPLIEAFPADKPTRSSVREWKRSSAAIGLVRPKEEHHPFYPVWTSTDWSLQTKKLPSHPAFCATSTSSDLVQVFLSLPEPFVHSARCCVQLVCPLSSDKNAVFFSYVQGIYI